jgi:hypothetical protein
MDDDEVVFEDFPERVGFQVGRKLRSKFPSLTHNRDKLKELMTTCEERVKRKLTYQLYIQYCKGQCPDILDHCAAKIAEEIVSYADCVEDFMVCKLQIEDGFELAKSDFFLFIDLLEKIELSVQLKNRQDVLKCSKLSYVEISPVKGLNYRTEKDSLQIGFRKENSFEPVTGLNKLVQARIFEYLKSGPIQEPFDCNSFIHFIFGFGYIYGNIDLCTDWVVRQFVSELSLFIGNAILMTKNEKISHVAMYIGKDTYLSKAGFGPVVATTLEEMKRIWDSDKIVIIDSTTVTL